MEELNKQVKRGKMSHKMNLQNNPFKLIKD